MTSRARMTTLVAILAATIVIAVVAIASLGLRLTEAPVAGPVTPSPAPSISFPLPSNDETVFGRAQSVDERKEASRIGGLSAAEAQRVRIVAGDRTLTFAVWRLDDGTTCGAVTRDDDPTLPADLACTPAADFALDGVTVAVTRPGDAPVSSFTWDPTPAGTDGVGR